MIFDVEVSDTDLSGFHSVLNPRIDVADGSASRLPLRVELASSLSIEGRMPGSWRRELNIATPSCPPLKQV
jgi:hypothetical protein